MATTAQTRFEDLLATAVREQTLVKLTLGKYRGSEPGLENVFIRPVTLKGKPHLTFVHRYATRDVTKNHAPDEGIALVKEWLAKSFLDAHLFTPAQTAQLTTSDLGEVRLKVSTATSAPMPVATTHDRQKAHPIPVDSPWLRMLGITNERGQPREAMAAKFRQINKFVELLQHLVENSSLTGRTDPFQVYDMACGKGYLTFAAAAYFGERARVHGVEARDDLVQQCASAAQKSGLAGTLSFSAGTIERATLPDVDVLIALHACDTATDDAIFRGIEKSATLIVVSPCCHKEVRAQLTPAPVLAPVLNHGIFQERQAEFATDGLRALLLEWAGYRTKVFEFISTEHTAKNLMIAATKVGPGHHPKTAEEIAAFAHFYGIKQQRLATLLGVTW